MRAFFRGVPHHNSVITAPNITTIADAIPIPVWNPKDPPDELPRGFASLPVSLAAALSVSLSVSSASSSVLVGVGVENENVLSVGLADANPELNPELTELNPELNPPITLDTPALAVPVTPEPGAEADTPAEAEAEPADAEPELPVAVRVREGTLNAEHSVSKATGKGVDVISNDSLGETRYRTHCREPPSPVRSWRR